MRQYRFKVGVSLALGESPDTDEQLEALVRSGMECVEILYYPYCDDGAWTASVKDRLRSAEVNINSVHAPFSGEVDISRLDAEGQESALQQVHRAMIMAAQLGAKIVVVHGSAEPIEEDERPQRIAQCKSSLSRLAKQAEALHVELALELLPRTCLGNTADELETLLADLPSEQAGFCLDTNHLSDPSQLDDTVLQLGKRIITLHISDYDARPPEYERHWMPFRGVVDWGSFANSLYDIQYSGSFIYEVELAGDSIEEKIEEVQSTFQRILSAAATQSR